MIGKENAPKILSDMMTTIYDNGLTSISGGNLSVRLDDGTVYVTPSGTDKGSLRPEDMNCVHADGRITGKHNPSVETPFHLSIYRAKPEAHAVIHAHAPSLLGASVLDTLPPVEILPHLAEVIGKLVFAPYDVPGSEALGKKIEAVFEDGADYAIMENHGVVLAGEDMDQAYYKLEALNLLVQAQSSAHILGELTRPEPTGTDLWRAPAAGGDAGGAARYPEAAAELGKYMRRIYQKQFSLSNPAMFCISHRAGDGMITNPAGEPLYRLVDSGAYVFVDGAGAFSHHQKVHLAIYQSRPDIHCIMTGLAPNVMSFAVTGTEFRTNMIPESYIVLQNVRTLNYEDYGDVERIVGSLNTSTNEIVFQNGCYLCAGPTAMKTYDRVEVLEYCSRAALGALGCGEIRYMDPSTLQDIAAAFGLPQ